FRQLGEKRRNLDRRRRLLRDTAQVSGQHCSRESTSSVVTATTEGRVLQPEEGVLESPVAQRTRVHLPRQLLVTVDGDLHGEREPAESLAFEARGPCSPQPPVRARRVCCRGVH